MQLNPAAFNRFLDGIGQSYKFRQSWHCPCFNPHSGAAVTGCPQCRGLGWLWGEEVPASAGAAGTKVQAQWAQFGIWESGDLVLSIPGTSPMWDMGQYARVSALNAKDRFSVALTRAAMNERLSFRVASITRVFWLHQTTKAVIEGTIPVVSADGDLSWPDGGGPPDTRQYSLTGTKYLDYYCWGEMPKNRNEHHGAKLPKLVVLRRWDLLSKALTGRGT